MERAYLFNFLDSEDKKRKDYLVWAIDDKTAVEKFFEEIPTINYGVYLNIFTDKPIFVQREYINISDYYSEQQLKENELGEIAFKELLKAQRKVEECLCLWRKHLILDTYAFHLSARVLQRKGDFTYDEKRKIYQESCEEVDETLKKWRIKNGVYNRNLSGC